MVAKKAKKSKPKPKHKHKPKPKAKKAARPAPKKKAVKKLPSKKAQPSIIISRRQPVIAQEMEGKLLTPAQISKFEEILKVKRDELLIIVQRKKEQELQTGEVEIGDEADIATRSVEKEMLFELTDSEKQTLDMIEAALRKVQIGVYGRCELCRKPIPRLRLEVMPWARYCIRCQAEQEIPVPEPVQVP